MIANQYNGRLAILYDRILRHRKISKDKSDTLWNINLNVPALSMKGVLMLFEDVAAQQPFARNTEAFYNPKITKCEVTIEGIPNQLFSQEMRAYQMWDEALVICTRQETPPRGGSGGERPGPGRGLSGRIPDKQVCFMA